MWRKLNESWICEKNNHRSEIEKNYHYKKKKTNRFLTWGIMMRFLSSSSSSLFFFFFFFYFGFVRFRDTLTIGVFHCFGFLLVSMDLSLIWKAWYSNLFMALMSNLIFFSEFRFHFSTISFWSDNQTVLKFPSFIESDLD